MEDRNGKRQALMALALVSAVALAFRLPNLHTTPAWDWDEGYNLNYGWHLSEGRIQWFSIKYSFIPHPPVYLLSLAAVVKLFGNSLLAARALNVLYSMLTLLLLYLTAAEVSDRKTALVSAFLYAIYPAAIYWGRTAMINNLLSTLVMLSLYSFIRHVRSGGGWWAISCVAAVAASLTAYIGLVLVATLSLYFLVKEPERVWKVLLILLTPLIAFAVIMLLLRDGYFVEDALYQLNRFNLLGPKTLLMLVLLIPAAFYFRRIKPFLFNLFESEVKLMFDSREYFNEVFVPSSLLFINFLLAYTLLKPFSDSSIFAGGDYFWFGTIGLLFVNASFRVYVVLLYFLPTFVATIVLGRSDHMLIQLYPLFALGVATLLLEFRRFLTRVLTGLRIPAASVAAVLILALPFCFTLYYDAQAFISTGVLKKEDVSSALDAAAYVNSVAVPGELVLTTSNLAGLIKADSTIVTQSLVYAGEGVAYYRPNMSADWFAQNCSIDNAAYVVVPPGALKWVESIEQGALGSRILKWPVAYRNRAYAVYRNPASDNPTAPKDKPRPENKE